MNASERSLAAAFAVGAAFYTLEDPRRTETIVVDGDWIDRFAGLLPDPDPRPAAAAGAGMLGMLFAAATARGAA